jgi:hypothetical protein
MHSYTSVGRMMETEAQQPSASSPLKPLGRAWLALIVVMLGEVAIILLIGLVLGERELPKVLQPAAFALLIMTRAIVPILMRQDGESWRKYVGPLTRITWLYAAIGILALTVGYRLFVDRPFPNFNREFSASFFSYFGTPLAQIMIAMQYLYYVTEGMWMVYVLVKASEAIKAWQPSLPVRLAGTGGGLFLGLTWGLAHTLTQGSLAVGLLGLLQAIVLGWLYGRTRSGLPPLLAWMAFLAL